MIDREAAGKLFLKVTEIFGTHMDAFDFSGIDDGLEQQVHWHIESWKGFEGYANIRLQDDRLMVWVDLFRLRGKGDFSFSVEGTDYEKIEAEFDAHMTILNSKTS